MASAADRPNPVTIHGADGPGRPRTLVVPMYNESGRIRRTIASLAEAVSLNSSTHFIFVDDGSNDGSAGSAKQYSVEFGLESFDVLELQPNRGKGHAVRIGVRHAISPSIVFVDADLSVTIRNIENAFEVLESGADVVYGSRHHPHSRMPRSQPWLRVVSGRLYNFLLRALGLTEERDTQCGLKGFRIEAAREVMSRSMIDGFGFDIESLALAQRLGLTIHPIPVDWSHVDDSRVSLGRHGLAMILSALRLRIRIGRTVRRSIEVTPMSSDAISAMGEFEDEHWWFAAKRKILLALLRNHPARIEQAIDVGCGTGGVLLALSSVGVRAIGIDIDDESIAFARRSGTPIVKADAQALPFNDRSADLVIAFDVIEHTADDVATLRELSRMLTDDGLLVIGVPAYQWAWSEHDVQLGHFRRYNRRGLIQAAEAAGLVVDRCSHYHWWLLLPAYLSRRSPLRRLFGENQEGLSFGNSAVNSVLDRMSSLELRLLERMDIPFGLSILLIARRPTR